MEQGEEAKAPEERRRGKRREKTGACPSSASAVASSPLLLPRTCCSRCASTRCASVLAVVRVSLFARDLCGLLEVVGRARLITPIPPSHTSSPHARQLSLSRVCAFSRAPTALAVPRAPGSFRSFGLQCYRVATWATRRARRAKRTRPARPLPTALGVSRAAASKSIASRPRARSRARRSTATAIRSSAVVRAAVAAPRARATAAARWSSTLPAPFLRRPSCLAPRRQERSCSTAPSLPRCRR